MDLLLLKMYQLKVSIFKICKFNGPVKVTNFGEFFDVMSKPNPNDLAYKPIALPPHTDNPYRKPEAPGIQFCIV